jgi:hypothetical protein
VIRYKSPGKTECFGFGKNVAEPIDKVIPINIIRENLFVFNATADYVV